MTGRGLTWHLGLQASDLAVSLLAAQRTTAGTRLQGAGCLQLTLCGARPGPPPPPGSPAPPSAADPAPWDMALQRALLLAGLLVEVASKSSDSTVSAQPRRLGAGKGGWSLRPSPSWRRALPPGLWPCTRPRCGVWELTGLPPQGQQSKCCADMVDVNTTCPGASLCGPGEHLA